MLTVGEAWKSLATMLNTIEETSTVPLSEAVGRSLLSPVFAPVDLPPFDSSAMDGYAIREQRSSNVGDRFTVVGESSAGHPWNKTLESGQACRIFTGAAIPEGATAVAIQEDVHRTNNTILIGERVRYGDNIRLRGMDIKTGDRLANKGEYLSPFAIGWLAACGLAEVEVCRKIKVAIFSTGDELQDPGNELKFGQIYESNRMSLSTLMQSKPVTVVDLGHLPDDSKVIKQAISKAAGEVDLIVASGGVSVGDRDLVRPAIEELGSLEFWNVALKPGKPLAVGSIGDSFFFGLPGNPVSTIITYMLFVAPAIDVLSGVPMRKPVTFHATLTHQIEHKSGRREYQRGICIMNGAVLQVTPTGDQSSNRLASFYQSNCLIEVPSYRGSMRPGELVEVWLFPGQHTFV